ncbi:MAG: hypothetical protein LBS82_01205 [Spirochaetaceae bacterium]|nr:hypothetical protein [Spirochaetaceae bacterium]
MTEEEAYELDELLTKTTPGVDPAVQGPFIKRRAMKERFTVESHVLEDRLGLDALLEGGWNLAEATAEYGPDFLSE